MKKYILMLVVLLPAMLWGDEYVGRGWRYGSLVGGVGGFPAYRGEVFNLAIGRGGKGKGVPGVGISVSLIEAVGFYEKGWQTQAMFPLYLRFMVPLSEIKHSDNMYYYPAVFHLFVSGCGWGVNLNNIPMSWIVVGGGIDWTFPSWPWLWLKGVEAGFLNIHNNSTDESIGGFYAGVKLGWDGWVPSGVSIAQGTYLFTKADNVPIVSSAGKVITRLPIATRVKILTEKGDNYYVQVSPILKGWISKKYISFGKPVISIGVSHKLSAFPLSRRREKERC